MQTEMVKRKFGTIQVDPSVLDEFREACESMAQSPSMSRTATGLVRWFIRQEPHVKTAVIGGVDKGMESVYADALERLAREMRHPKLQRVGVTESSEEAPEAEPKRRQLDGPRKR